MRGGAQFKSGRDMTCYLGDPDVDYAKAAQAFRGRRRERTKDQGYRPGLGASQTRQR